MTATKFRLGAAAIATVLAIGAAVPAYAQGRHHHRNNDNAAGAAALGLLGGLALGAAISNAQPAPPPPAYYYPPTTAYVAPNPHADWCARNTPGYNAYDNTYQGYYAGERIYCRSPYGG